MLDHDPFLLTDLKPDRTGLLFVVWLSVRPDTETEPCIWIAPDMLKVPLDGPIADANLARWLRLNHAAILAHWNGDTDSAEVIAAIQPLK